MPPLTFIWVENSDLSASQKALMQTVMPLISASVESDEYLQACEQLRRQKKAEAASASKSEYAPINLYIRQVNGRFCLHCPHYDFVLEASFQQANLLRRLSGYNLAKEYAVRAVVGRKAEAQGLKLIDMTAGLGVDSLLLAAAGCEVSAFEENPWVAFLCAAALLDAQENSAEPLLREAASRIQLQCCNSVGFLENTILEKTTQACDVAFLDPMFFVAKKSAASKKGMAFLHRLLNEDTCEQQSQNEQQLMQVARHIARERVVVKRAPKAAYLNNQTPASSLSGKAARFDIYPL